LGGGDSEVVVDDSDLGVVEGELTAGKDY